jgi:hypothetical protein
MDPQCIQYLLVGSIGSGGLGAAGGGVGFLLLRRKIANTITTTAIMAKRIYGRKLNISNFGGSVIVVLGVVGVALTINVNVVLSFNVPEAPYITILYVPSPTLFPTDILTVALTLPLGGGVTLDGDIETVTPLGGLDDSETELEKPIREPTVTVTLPLSPCIIVVDVGLTSNVKEGVRVIKVGEIIVIGEIMVGFMGDMGDIMVGVA